MQPNHGFTQRPHTGSYRADPRPTTSRSRSREGPILPRPQPPMPTHSQVISHQLTSGYAPAQPRARSAQTMRPPPVLQAAPVHQWGPPAPVHPINHRSTQLSLSTSSSSGFTRPQLQPPPKRARSLSPPPRYAPASLASLPPRPPKVHVGSSYSGAADATAESTHSSQNSRKRSKSVTHNPYDTERTYQIRTFDASPPRFRTVASTAKAAASKSREIAPPTFKEVPVAAAAATTAEADGLNKNWITFQGANTPALITARITKTPTLETLCELLGTGGNFVNFNAISLSAAVNRLGKLTTEAGPGYVLPSNLPSVFEKLVSKAEKMIPTFDPRAIASLLHGVALSGFFFVDTLSSSVRRLYLALVKDIETRRYSLDSFKPQELCNVVWSLAKVEWDCSIFTLVASYLKSLPSLREYTAQGLSNIAWSMARMGIQDHDLFDRIAQESILRRFSGFEPQHTSNLVWAMATLEYKNTDFLDALFVFLDNAQLAVFTAQNLSNIVWSMAQFQIENNEFLDRLALAIRNLITQFDPQQISIIAWTFAKLGKSNDELLSVIQSEVLRRDLALFDSQSLTITLWGLATLHYPCHTLFQTVGEHCMARGLESFSGQALANLTWAFGTAQEPNPELFAQVARVFAQDGLEKYKASEVTNLVWAFAVSRESLNHPGVMSRIAQHAVAEGLGLYDAQSLAHLFWAFATANVDNSTFYDTLMAELKLREDLSFFTEVDLGMIAWASSVLGLSNSELLGVLAAECSQRLLTKQFSFQALADLVWSFACCDVYSDPRVARLLQRAAPSVSPANAATPSSAVQFYEAIIAWREDVGGELPELLQQVAVGGWMEPLVEAHQAQQRQKLEPEVSALVRDLESSGCRCTTDHVSEHGVEVAVLVTTPTGLVLALEFEDAAQVVGGQLPGKKFNGLGMFKHRLLVKAMGGEDRVKTVSGWRSNLQGAEREAIVKSIMEAR